MKKILESEKNKLGKLYSKALLNLFFSGKISESEMDIIIRDVQALYKVMTRIKLWLDFTFTKYRFSFKKEELINIFNSAIFPLLNSEITKIWVKEQINKDRFVVLEKSFRYFLRSILLIDIKVPEYIELSDKHKDKIKYFVKSFYKDKITERSRVRYIMLNYEQIKTKPDFNAGAEYIKLANQIFDFEINMIDEKIFKI